MPQTDFAKAQTLPFSLGPRIDSLSEDSETRGQQLLKAENLGPAGLESNCLQDNPVTQSLPVSEPQFPPLSTESLLSSQGAVQLLLPSQGRLRHTLQRAGPTQGQHLFHCMGRGEAAMKGTH